MSIASEEIAEQVAANQSALPYYAEFRGHRERLTALTCAAAAKPSGNALCVLGAGNAYDLDLPQLASHFEQIHLVDLDASAVQAVVERHDAATRARISCHAPLDLSGMHDRLERWARMQLTPQEVMEHAERTAAAIRNALGRRFDVVLSACMLSQMQLSLLRALGADHRLFEALRVTLNVTHLSTLVELLVLDGRGLLVTDASSNLIAPYGAFETEKPPLELLSQLARAGNVFAFADPAGLRQLFEQDPRLSAAAELAAIRDAWIWSNGPASHFLVYALELTRKR